MSAWLVTPDGLPTVEGLLVIILALCALAVLFALLAYVQAKRGRAEALGPLEAADLLRREGDAIRGTEEQRMASLRQELGGTLSQFQTGTIASVNAMSEQLARRVDSFGERLDLSNRTIQTRVESIGGKLNDDLAQMAETAAGNRDALRGAIEQRLDAANTAQAASARALREELDGSFQRMRLGVGETLRAASDQQRERLEQTKGALEALSERHASAGEQLRATVEGRLDLLRRDNTEKLEEMRRTVDEKLQTTLEARLGESFNRVVEQLSLVSQGIGEMRNLANNVGDLKTVLTNPKVRGTFGEVQLALLIEDFLTPDQYLRNAQIKPNSGERVEYAIRVRTGADDEEMLLPVDAKFPREDYDRLIAAIHEGDTVLAAKFRKELETRVKLFARSIRDKYIDPPRTAEFGILFLPTEGLYAELLREPALFDFLRRECGVVLAGPTTFSAILSAFQMNFRSMALAQRSTEVWKVLSAVRNEFGRYNEVVGKLGNQLRTAANSVDKLSVRARAMDRTLRDVQRLPDDASAQRLLGLTEESLANVEDDEEAADLRALDAQSETVVSLRSGG